MTDREITRLVAKYLFDEIKFTDVQKLLTDEEMAFFIEEYRRHGVYKVAPKGKAQ